MPGFRSNSTDDVVYAKNFDFSDPYNVTALGHPKSTMLLDGQLIIGSTALNGGGTHCNIGTLTAGAGVTITNGPGTIAIGLTGGMSAVEHLTGNTGGTLNPDGSNNFNILGATQAAGTTPFTFAGVGATLTGKIQISQAIAATDATKIGLSNFNSSQFSVDANGFVSIIDGGFAWSDVSGAFSPLKQNGYFITATATGTLPASPAQGDTIQFFVDHASQVLTIQATGTQIIRMGSLVSSAAGTWVSTLQGDSCELVYRSSNTCWEAVDFIGTWVKT